MGNEVDGVEVVDGPTVNGTTGDHPPVHAKGKGKHGPGGSQSVGKGKGKWRNKTVTADGSDSSLNGHKNDRSSSRRYDDVGEEDGEDEYIVRTDHLAGK